MKKITYLAIITLLCITSSTSFSQLIKGTYAIKNVKTGMLLRIKDANKKDGTPLVAYSPVNWKCMTWDFQHADSNTYQLKNLFTNKTFQPANAEPSDGTGLEQKPLVVKGANQLYEFIPAGESVYLIRLKNTELYLTPSDQKESTNSEIILSKKTNSELQRWMIYIQHPDF